MKLYAVKIDLSADQGMVDRLWDRVSAEKQQRLTRLRRLPDVLRSLTADVLARRSCAAWLGCLERDIRWEYNDYGKPLVHDAPACCFNVSHSGEWVVCAVDAFPVGVDVEQVHRVDFDLFRQCFTESECRYVTGGEDALSRFFELWTFKEAYVKAVGKGLSLPLQSFSVEIGEPEGRTGERTARVAQNGGYADCVLRQRFVAEGYKLAVCMARDERPVPVRQLAIGEL